MNKSYSLFLICLILLSPTVCRATKTVAGEVTPVVGYRQDNLKWTLKNKSSGKWKNPKFVEYGIKAKATIKDRYVFNFDILVGNLIGGSYHDNHYLNPVQTSNISAQKTSSLAFRPNIGIGYKFKPTRYFNIIPQVGFIYDLLYLKTKKVAAGPLSEFKDTVQWYGPWIGLDTTTKLTRRWTLDLGGAYGIAFYKNSGTWILPPFQIQNKMNQHATGQMVSGRVRLQYEIVKSVSLGGEADMAWKWARSGRDSREFLGTNSPLKNKLSKITGSTWGAHLVLTKAF